MRYTATILLFLIFAQLQGLQAQTKIIAHKSHSGQAVTFDIESVHNFGERIPPRMLEFDSIWHVKDSVFILIRHNGLGEFVKKDTLDFTPFPNAAIFIEKAKEADEWEYEFLGKYVWKNMSLEDIKKIYHHTVFIDFEKKKQQKSYLYLTPFIIPDKSDKNQNNSNDLIFWLFGGIFLFGLSLSYSIWKTHTSNGHLVRG